MGGENPILWQLLLQVVLVLLNAIFACTEIAFISINDKKLAKLAAQGNKRAVKLLKLTEKPGKFLSVVQVGITFAGFLGSAFAADNFADKLTLYLVDAGIGIPEATLDTIAVVVVTIILSYFTLVLGELIPKRIALRHGEKIGLAMSGFIGFVSKLFAPIVWILTISTNGVLRLMGIDPNAEGEQVTEEEIRLMVDACSARGAIDFEEREFIHNLFDFDDRIAEQVMTHRLNVSLLWMDENTEQWENTISESTHTLYPVCDKTIDNVIGILNTKDYFRLKEKSRENILNLCVKPAYFVLETLGAHVLFRNMKKNRNHFAVVLDEYGGMSGIVTMNDLLEQLVGNLDDDAELPPEPPFIERIDSKTWKISGAAPLGMVCEHLGIVLSHARYETFGGMVFGLIGTIPEDGQTPEVEGYGLHIQVTSIVDRRLVTALVRFSTQSGWRTREG